MKLISPSFEEGSFIPEKHTCDGLNSSPELRWSEVPEGTESFVLLCDDPDAIPVCGHVWDHWTLYNIPPDIREIAEDHLEGSKGMTSFGKPGYGGPCPPNGEHTYIFKLFALDTLLDLPSLPDKKTIEKAMEGHILDHAILTGRYNRQQ